MSLAPFVPDLLAASRTNPALLNLLLPLVVGMVVGGLSMLLFYLGSKKNRVTIDGAFWQKVMLYGVCGLVAGYFSMRITIRKNPGLFGNGPALSSKQLKAITENPLPKLPQPKLTNPLAPWDRERAPKVTTPLTKEQEEKTLQQAEQRRKDHERRVQQQREEHEQRIRQQREEQELRAQRMKEEREAQIKQQQADQQAAQTKEQGLQQEDQDYLSSLSLAELEKVRDERKAEIDVTKELMRDPNATADERQAASGRFSKAVKAYQAAFKAVMEKRRQERELNR